ncbi:MAG: chitobiase/beta-hexosaminidase C-terminal domain-containing protein [Muribaculaceae bacterium]|nr:chitobiase/beta-hexosaminidase C-terminal domain-containing protein [Muribaculaceae bacterium]
MKKVLSLVMMALLSVGAWASEIVLNMNNVDLTWTANGDDYQTTSQGITIYYAKASSSTAPSQGLTANHIRFYKNTTVKISAGSSITKIVFTPDGSYTADACFGPNVGAMSGQEWTGSASEILFTMNAQYRCKKMVITLDDGSIATPYFNPAEGTYYGPTDVSIHGQEGSTVYYTLDGTDPTTSSAVYSAPITISQTTTVKAIAEKDGNTSAIATATYTIETAPTVANIAAFAALTDNSNAAISNPVVVTYANGMNTYVKDATGFLCIYGSDLSGKYSQGDVIPAGFGGVKTTYNNGPEMKFPFFGFQDATETQAVEADEVTVANFGQSAMWQYVVLKGATIAYHSGKYLGFRVDNSTDSVAGYNQFNLTLPDLDATYDIYGIVTSYQGNIQMYPIEFVDTNPTTVASIAELLALETGKNATFTTPVTAVYHSGKQLYIKDTNDDFMLVYGSLSNTYNNGDVLNDIAGNWTVHNGLTEMIPVASTFGEATPGTPVLPELIPIEEIDQSMIHHYLRIENCSIDSIAGSNGRNFTLTDETGDMIMRLNFSGVTIGDDFDYDATYNVEGFLAYYKSGETEQLQFYPNLIEKVGGTVVVPGDVDGDGFVTAGDVTILYNYLLNGTNEGMVNGDQDGDGVITAGDVTFIYNLLLGNK